MKISMQCRGIISLLTIIFLLCGQVAFSMEPSVNILGDVVGKGSTEMKTAFNKWISISDKAYPLMDGSHLRSGDGMLSSIFRDGPRMEVGKNSEIIVTGSRGNYMIDLVTGKIAFSVPPEIGFSVTTPTSTIHTQVQPNMIRTVSATSQDYVRGSVGFDGKGTTITTVSGTIMVKDARGAAAHTITAGNSLYIGGAESGYRTTPAQLATVETLGADTGLSPLIVVGGGAVVIGGAALIVNSATKRGVASPSVP